MNKSYAAWAARWRVPLGFAAGIVYIVAARPQAAWLAAGAVPALLGLGMRAWAAGCLEKNQNLAMRGPYALTRNPLYFGSFLLALGFAIASANMVLGAGLMVVFLLVYWPVILREEAFLKQKFRDAYAGYGPQVPLFFPDLRKIGSAGKGFRLQLYRRNHEYKAALGFAVMSLLLLLKMVWRGVR